MKRIFFLLTASLLFFSCGNKNDFHIQGTLQNGANKMVYIEELTPDGPLFIDSIRLDSKGKFSFQYTMPYESFYNLHVSENSYIMLIPQAGEKIEVKADYNALEYSYEVYGSPESALMWQIQQYGNQGREQLVEIIAMDRDNRANLHGKDSLDARAVTDSLYKDLFKDQQSFIIHFIEDHRGSLSTIIAVYKTFNGDEALINPAYNMDWYEEVLAGLEEMKPTNPHTQHFALSVAALRARNKQPVIE